MGKARGVTWDNTPASRGNTMRAREPAEANHPITAPWGVHGEG